ncbi:MAG: TRAP transporter substrate-binding protein [Treponema sp.]|nr:TRAP transporter substrate-binding protein [Treponema sp.]
MRKFAFIALAAAVLGTALVSCKPKEDSGKEITLVMAEVNPAETIAGQMDQAFKRKVEELSGGKIKIDLQCSGILGDVESIMDLMMKPGSTIQIHRMSAVNMATYGCRKSSLLGIPYTFSSKEHFWNFALSETGKKILNEPVEVGLGVKGLFYGEEGFRNFFSKTKIEKVQDFNGLKVRGTNDNAMQGMIAAFGAESVPVNYADLYAKLQTGVISVAEQPIANYLANHFYEVAPYMILDGHTLGVMETVITMDAWNSLSERQQNILLEAGKYASEFCRELSAKEEDRVKAELVKAGATITEVKDIRPWQAACSKVIEQSSSVDSELYKKILELAE